MREAAQAAGALTVSAPTPRCSGSTSRTARVARLRTTRGEIEAERVVICCGVWSPRIARMAGADDPADADGPPDDRHRPGAALRDERRRRVPDRARHGHQHVRAPGGRQPRDRLLRAPPDPPRPRRDPLDRGLGALADRAAVHAGRLRAPARAGPRADARDRRRRVGRHQVRDQRPALGDRRRPAAARRDARGARPVERRGGLDQGGARASARRSPS